MNGPPSIPDYRSSFASGQQPAPASATPAAATTPFQLTASLRNLNIRPFSSGIETATDEPKKQQEKGRKKSPGYAHQRTVRSPAKSYSDKKKKGETRKDWADMTEQWRKEYDRKDRVAARREKQNIKKRLQRARWREEAAAAAAAAAQAAAAAAPGSAPAAAAAASNSNAANGLQIPPPISAAGSAPYPPTEHPPSPQTTQAVLAAAQTLPPTPTSDNGSGANYYTPARTPRRFPRVITDLPPIPETPFSGMTQDESTAASIASFLDVTSRDMAARAGRRERMMGIVESQLAGQNHVLESQLAGQNHVLQGLVAAEREEAAVSAGVAHAAIR